MRSATKKYCIRIVFPGRVLWGWPLSLKRDRPCYIPHNRYGTKHVRRRQLLSLERPELPPIKSRENRTTPQRKRRESCESRRSTLIWRPWSPWVSQPWRPGRSEEHTSELQSHLNLVCRLLLEKKKINEQLHQDAMTA